MHEGVTIRNPNTDLKSEFGGLDTAKERERSAREAGLANGQARRGAWGGCEAHCQQPPLPPWASQATEVSRVDLSSLSLSFISFKILHSLPFILRRKNRNPYVQNFLSTFSHLPNTITFSYEVRIEWFKLEIVCNRVLYIFQVVLQLFDWLFWWFYPKIRTSSWSWGSVHIFVISSFITFNLLGVSSSICMCMYGECYWER